jgi:hypothetical protein
MCPNIQKLSINYWDIFVNIKTLIKILMLWMFR